MSKIKVVLTLAICLCIGASLSAQNGYHFGTKGGLSIGTQNWNGGERSPLFSYHFNGFVETLDPDLRGSLFASLGLHTRGSSLGFRGFNFNNTNRNSYRFRNLSLMLGAKKVLDREIIGARPYYFAGIRGEYTISNNMREIQDNNTQFLNNNIFPNGVPTNFIIESAFVNQWLYGISFGGGFEFFGSEFFNTALEFTVSPDLNFQYNRLPGQIQGTDALQIRNVSFEVSLVFRFLREIIYEE